MKVTITLPRIPAGALSNLAGLAGLIAAVVAIGGLAGVWWAVLAGGLVAVGLSALAQAQDAMAARPAKSAPAAARARTRPMIAEDAAA